MKRKRIDELRLSIENPRRQLPGLLNRQSTIVNRKFLVLFGDRNHASVGYFTHRMFELDRGVVDTELGMQTPPDIAEDTFAGRRRNVGDGNMAGERAGFRAEVPDVQVVDIVYSLNLSNGSFHALKFYSSRRAFEQDVQSLPHDTEA